MTPESRDFRARLRESAPHFNPLEDGKVWTREELGIERVERRQRRRRLAIGAGLALLMAAAGFTFVMAMRGGL